MGRLVVAAVRPMVVIVIMVAVGGEEGRDGNAEGNGETGRGIEVVVGRKRMREKGRG